MISLIWAIVLTSLGIVRACLRLSDSYDLTCVAGIFNLDYYTIHLTSDMFLVGSSLSVHRLLSYRRLVNCLRYVGFHAKFSYYFMSPT